MRKLFFAVAVSVVILNTTKAQSKLGDVACVYIATTDLDSSAAVYGKLGFKITGSNTFPVPWTQVSDGSLIIMLRKDASPYMGLTYYSNNTERIASQLEKDSIVFTQKPKAGDAIKRYYFKSPDGFMIMLADNLGGFEQPKGQTILNMPEADFMNPEKFPNAACGVFGEYCHPVTDLDNSILFWKKIGFTVKYKTTIPYPHAILTDGLMIIGLHQTTHFDYPAITYFGLNTEKRVGQLKEKGLTQFSEAAGKNNQVLLTWEKQHFFIFNLGM
jgi:predicted lactoylglutathione lyase